MTKFDELNTIVEHIKTLKWEELKPEEKKECEDIIEDLLIYQWTMGWDDANKELQQVSLEQNPFDILADLKTEEEVKKEMTYDPLDLKNDLEHKIEGITYRQRIREADTSAKIANIADTEAMRMYNSAVTRVAKKNGAAKTWNTMLDSKVRDTHAYLEGMTVGADEAFFTYDGDSAEHPGGFTSASNNCGCRCYLTIKK